MAGERVFGDDPGWKANVPDFRDMPAGGVTDDAGDRFHLPAVQDMSTAPGSAAVESGVHIVLPKDGPDNLSTK